MDGADGAAEVQGQGRAHMYDQLSPGLSAAHHAFPSVAADCALQSVRPACGIGAAALSSEATHARTLRWSQGRRAGERESSNCCCEQKRRSTEPPA